MVDEKVLRENIVAALGLEALPEEKKAQLIDRMAELAEKRIILRLMEELPPKGHQEFEKVAKKGDQAKMKFLQEKFPNLAEIVQEEVVKVKKEVIEQGRTVEEDLKELE